MAQLPLLQNISIDSPIRELEDAPPKVHHIWTIVATAKKADGTGTIKLTSAIRYCSGPNAAAVMKWAKSKAKNSWLPHFENHFAHDVKIAKVPEQHVIDVAAGYEAAATQSPIE